MATGTNLWESLFNQTPPPSLTSSSSDFQTLPAWYQDFQKGILQYASQATPTSMPLYQGNRQADLSNPATQAKIQGSFSSQERQAFDKVGALQGQYQPWIDQAGALTTSSANANAANMAGDYMSPYIQNVTDRLGVLAGRNLSENILPQLSDQFVGAGQMSGTRLGEFTSRAVRDTQDSLLAAQGNLLNLGYGQALGAAQTDLSRQLSGGQQLADLAQTGQNYGLTDAGALASVGSQISGKAQQGADIAYQDFQDQMNWPLRNIAVLNSALRGSPPPVSGTTTTTSPAGSYGISPLAAGVAAGQYGLGFKRGGRVGALSGGRGRSEVRGALSRAA